MKKLLSRLMVATSFCAVMLSVSCNKEDISPVTTNVYNSMVSLWQQRESPNLHKAIDNYVARYSYTLFRDTVYGTGRAISYLCQTDTAIYLLNVWFRNDSLLSLKCSLYSPRQHWMQEQITRFEQEMYNRHPNDYIGGSFYWYLRPDILNTVDGGDVRTHDLFVQRTVEHARDVWEWVEARTRYALLIWAKTSSNYTPMVPGMNSTSWDWTTSQRASHTIWMSSSIFTTPPDGTTGTSGLN